MQFYEVKGGLIMTDCSVNDGTADDRTFPGKIAVITDYYAATGDDFHCADRLIAKYSADKIIHISWPVNFAAEQDTLVKTAAALAADREVKALIFNQAIEGSNAAVDKFKETRDDAFIVYCKTNEPSSEAAFHANLILSPNELGMGPAIAEQARKQGAKVFVHYSFPRHMEMQLLSGRRDRIRKTCMEEGLQFVDAVTLDPLDETGIIAAQKFILKDVPRLVAKYGENTAFFSTNCALQAPLIKAVVDSHAIYPQPCCPSPYNGFPEALGIKIEEGKADLNYVIGEACRIAAEMNMTDRLSTWPVSASMMFTNAGAEYAIKWLKGEVPKTGIDKTILLECMDSFIQEVVGEASNVYMTTYSYEGVTCENFKLVLMSYLDF